MKCFKIYGDYRCLNGKSIEIQILKNKETLRLGGGGVLFCSFTVFQAFILDCQSILHFHFFSFCYFLKFIYLKSYLFLFYIQIPVLTPSPPPVSSIFPPPHPHTFLQEDKASHEKSLKSTTLLWGRTKSLPLYLGWVRNPSKEHGFQKAWISSRDKAWFNC